MTRNVCAYSMNDLNIQCGVCVYMENVAKKMDSQWVHAARGSYRYRGSVWFVPFFPFFLQSLMLLLLLLRYSYIFFSLSFSSCSLYRFLSIDRKKCKAFATVFLLYTLFFSLVSVLFFQRYRFNANLTPFGHNIFQRHYSRRSNIFQIDIHAHLFILPSRTSYFSCSFSCNVSFFLCVLMNLFCFVLNHFYAVMGSFWFSFSFFVCIFFKYKAHLQYFFFGLWKEKKIKNNYENAYKYALQMTVFHARNNTNGLTTPIHFNLSLSPSIVTFHLINFICSYCNTCFHHYFLFGFCFFF